MRDPHSAPARPHVLCFPSRDHAFAAYVAATLAAIEPRAPGELTLALRHLYPRAEVRLRELSAEMHPTWYALRDGTAAGWVQDSWWEAPGTACIRSRGGEILDANEAAEDLLGYPRGGLVGSDPYALMSPELTDDTEVVRRVLSRQGSIETTYRMRGADGELRDVEARADAHADGTFTTWLRPVAWVRGEDAAEEATG
jgi:PAS domain S-box-containing protein